MSEHLVVLVTAPDAEIGEAIARALVEERLAACVSLIGSIRSIYRWAGAIEQSAEQQLLIKTRRDRFEALQRRLVELHPYEVPECLALPVEAGLPAYLGWIDACCDGANAASD